MAPFLLIMVGDYFLYCMCQSFTTVERQLFNKRFTFYKKKKTPLNTSSIGPNTPHSQSNLLYFLFQAIHFKEISTRSYITADF